MSRRPGSPLRRLADIAFVLILAFAAFYASHRWGGSAMSGRHYRAVDGDSLRNGDTEVRLYGIDAPELHQDCRDSGGRPYACGRRALEHLRSLMAGRSITCTQFDIDRYGRKVARCEAGDTDLGRAMVKDGWAVAYLRHAIDYAVAEAEARVARRGLWVGDFETPEDWRRAHRRQGSF